MTSPWLGIRDLPGLSVSVDQRYGSRQVGVKTRATTAVLHLFWLLGRRSLMCAEGVEALENESTVVTKQFVQPEDSYKEDRIVIIALDPLALAPWTLHTDPF